VETARFDYELPDAAIAQSPIEPRDAARMLVDGGAGGEARHQTVTDLPDLLGPGDVVVVDVEPTGCLDAGRIGAVPAEDADATLCREHRVELLDGESVPRKGITPVDDLSSWVVL